MQDILTYIALLLAVAFLIKKFFFPKKSKKSCGMDCGCWWFNGTQIHACCMAGKLMKWIFAVIITLLTLKS